MLPLFFFSFFVPYRHKINGSERVLNPDILVLQQIPRAWEGDIGQK